MNKTLSLVLIATFLSSTPTKSIESCTTCHRKSQSVVLHGFKSAFIKAKNLTCQRPGTVITGIAIAGGLTYGFYRLLYWYFHTPNSRYYKRAVEFAKETDYAYHDIFGQLDAYTMYRLSNKEQEADEGALALLAEAKRPACLKISHIQKTIKRLSNYARSLKKRARSLQSKKNKSSEEIRLTDYMETLRKTIKVKQLNPLVGLQEIIHVHEPYFVLHNRISTLKRFYGEQPEIPDDFVENNGDRFGFVEYTSKLSRELKALKAIASRACYRYEKIYDEAGQLRTNLRQRICLISDTQTYRNQVIDKRWHDRFNMIENINWLRNNLLP